MGGLKKTAAHGETEPLLSDEARSLTPPVAPAGARGLLSPYVRVLIASFFLSVAFVFTSTPLLFAVRTMECQEYYLQDGALPPPELADRCALKEVEAATARSISVMFSLTCVSGFINLLVTTWEIKRFGVRAALIQQTAWPVVRNVCQTWAVRNGYRFGVQLLQVTQLITILGGGAGYLLAANTFLNDVVGDEERTGAFGVLSGVAMAGTALGYTVGGLAGDYISPVAPFEITFCLLVASTLFTAFFLPYIPPATPAPAESTVQGDGPKEAAVSGGPLACLRVFIPRKNDDGRGRYWGLTLLGLGAFMGVLATAFVPLMLQLTATNRYDFKPAQNGYLMSLNSASRALFLTLVFPRIVARGRRWYSAKRSSTSAGPSSTSSPSPTPTLIDPDELPITAEAFEPVSGLQEVEEPVNVPVSMAPTDAANGSAFDLVFLKWSMVLDAALTALVGLNMRSSEILLAAVILPLASGTAPACKGVMMELVPTAQRADALSAISLLETAAYIITSSLFGPVMAKLSDIGKPNLVFPVNGGIALAAGIVLLFVRFPRAKEASSAA